MSIEISYDNLPIKVTYVTFIFDFSSKNLFIFLPEMAKQMGIYRPRSPQKSPFYQCIADQFEEFVQVCDERFEREYEFRRPVIYEVIQKSLQCGYLTHGFARVHCDYCRHEYLLALVTKGGFDAYSVFHALPWTDTQKTAIVYADKVFSMLIREGKISEALAGRICDWPNSGFNIHNEVEIKADDDKGNENLTQYIIKFLRDRSIVICGISDNGIEPAVNQSGSNIIKVIINKSLPG